VNGSGSDPTPRSDSLHFLLFIEYVVSRDGLPLRPETATEQSRPRPGGQTRPGPFKDRNEFNPSAWILIAPLTSRREWIRRWALIPRWSNRQDRPDLRLHLPVHGMRDILFTGFCEPMAGRMANHWGKGRGIEQEINIQTPTVGVRVGSRL